MTDPASFLMSMLRSSRKEPPPEALSSVGQPATATTSNSSASYGGATTSVSSMPSERNKYTSNASSAVAAAAAAGHSSSNPRGPQPQGRVLPSGPQVVYNIDERLPGEAQPQLEVTPITLLKAELARHQWQQVAVNASYISYRVKQGHLRLLDRGDASRGLLKRHEASITDLRFYSPLADLLASCDAAGTVLVHGITNQSREVVGDTLMRVVLQGAEPGTGRVAWHPSSDDVLAFGSGSTLILASVAAASASAGGPDALAEVACPLEGPPPGGMAALGWGDAAPGQLSSNLSISQDGSALACGTVDGRVLVFELPPFPEGASGAEYLLSLRQGPAPRLAASFTPFGGAKVAAVHWLQPAGTSTGAVSGPGSPPGGPGVLLVADDPCVRLALFRGTGGVGAGGEVPSGGSPEYGLLQEMRFDSGDNGAFYNHVDPGPQGGGLVVVANTNRDAVYALHLSTASSPAPHFDYIAEFSVSRPVLSMAVQAAEDEQHPGRQLLRMYCVQTNGIQQYTIDPALCRPPAGAEPVVVPGETAARTPSVLANLLLSPPASLEGAPAAAAPGPTAPAAAAPGPTAPAAQPEEGKEEQAVPAPSATVIPAVPSGKQLLTPAPNPEQQLAPAPAPEQLLAPSATVIPVMPSCEQQPLAPAPTPEQPLAPAPTPGPGVLATGPAAGSQSSLSAATMAAEAEAAAETKAAFPSANVVDGAEPAVAAPGAGGARPSEEVPRAPPPTPADDDWQQETDESAARAATAGIMARVKVLARPAASSGATPASSGAPPSSSSSRAPPEPLPPMPPPPLMPPSPTAAVIPPPAAVAADKPPPVAAAPAAVGVPAAAGKRQQQAAAARGAQAAAQAAQAAAQGAEEEEELEEGELPRKAPEVHVFPLSSGAAGEEDALGAADGRATSGTAEPVSTSASDSAAAAINGTKAAAAAAAAPPLRASAAAPAAAAAPRVQATGGVSAGDLQAMLSGLLAAQRKQLMQDMQAAQTAQTKAVRALVKEQLQAVEQRNSAALQRLVKQQAQAVASERSAVLQAQRQETDRLIASLSGAVNRDLPLRLQEIVRQEVSAAVSSALPKALPQALAGGALQGELERAITTQLQAGLQRPLQDGFRTGFQKSVIPAFEAAVQTMFGQVQESLSKGLAEHLQASQASAQQLSRSMQEATQQLQQAAAAATAASSSISAAAQQQQRGGGTSGAGASGSTMTTASGPGSTSQPVAVVVDPMEEVRQLLGAREYNEAFTKALVLNDVDKVVWLCRQLDTSTVLPPDACPLSQPVLLSLVQQLGHDLSKHADVKLRWLQDGVMALQPRDAVIAPHLRGVLTSVYSNLQLTAPQLRGEQANLARVAMHVVNSLLHQCQ